MEKVDDVLSCAFPARNEYGKIRSYLNNNVDAHPLWRNHPVLSVILANGKLLKGVEPIYQ